MRQLQTFEVPNINGVVSVDPVSWLFKLRCDLEILGATVLEIRDSHLPNHVLVLSENTNPKEKENAETFKACP